MCHMQFRLDSSADRRPIQCGARPPVEPTRWTASPLATYDRTRDLPALLPIWPAEVRDLTPETHHRLIQRLRRALREERRRGLAGSWTYDLARHVRLNRALKSELASLPPPLSSWVVHAFVAPEVATAANPAACRVPSSSPVASARRRSSAPPSDSRAAAATWSDIPPATSCNEYAGAASAT